MWRWILLALLPLTAACATTAATSEPPAFFVMRHLHTPAGERDLDLTEEGRRHADQLADMLGGEDISAIYVSDYKRTRQTAAPLAARLGLTPIVYDPADTPALVARVSSETGGVLVVGHSNTVPDIVEQLGGARPAALVHEDFGDVWRIGTAGTTRLRIPAPIEARP